MEIQSSSSAVSASTSANSDLYMLTGFIQDVAIELFIFVVTLLGLLTFHKLRHIHGNKPCADPHSPRTDVHPRFGRTEEMHDKNRKPRHELASKVERIIEAVREQQTIRAAHHALQIYEEMKLDVARDWQKIQQAIRQSKYDGVVLFSTLMQCAIRIHRFQLVDGFLFEMRKVGVARSTSFYEVIMKQLAGQKQFAQALKVYERMDADACAPSPVTMSCVIGFAAEIGDDARAVSFFNKLKEICKPSIRAYMTILRVHLKQNDFPSSMEILQDMTQQGVKIDSLALNQTLATGIACGKTEAVAQLIEDVGSQPEGLPSSAVDIVSYNTLIKGYAQKGDVDGCSKALERLTQRGLKPNAITLNTSIDCAIRAGRFDEVWRLFERMISLSIEPDKFTCSIMVKGLSRSSHHLGDAYVQQLQTILAMMEKLDSSFEATLRTSLYTSILETTVARSEEAIPELYAQIRRVNATLNAKGHRLIVRGLK